MTILFSRVEEKKKNTFDLHLVASDSFGFFFLCLYILVPENQRKYRHQRLEVVRQLKLLSNCLETTTVVMAALEAFCCCSSQSRATMILLLVV